MGRDYGGWAPYVSVSEKKAQALKKAMALRKKGKEINPITIEGRALAKTFWGTSWCKNLEAYTDYANRLPRGRAYVRHGCVVDLKIDGGEIKALVHGSSLYTVHISINALQKEKWKSILQECMGKIDSMIELLQGKFSKSMMEIMTNQDKGLFPKPQEIKFKCSCFDYADLCKHIAAVLYGVGARLDEDPHMLFMLRHVNPMELITSINTSPLTFSSQGGEKDLKDTNLSELFGIEIEQGPLQKLKTSKENNRPLKNNPKKSSVIKKKKKKPKTTFKI